VFGGRGCYITTVTKGCYSCIIVIPFRLPIAEGGQDGVVGLWSGTTLAGWGIISGGLNFMMDIFDFLFTSSTFVYSNCVVIVVLVVEMLSCRIRVWVLLGRIGKKSFKMNQQDLV
jgi:hypothetical protein